jgi:hypothetical protein
MAITVRHTDGHYSLERDSEWIEPTTWIVVEGVDTVKIEVDSYGLQVR